MKRLGPLGNYFEVTVLICTRNRSEAAIRCVRSLLAQTRLPDELIIVDSSDAAGLEAQMREVIDSKISLQYKRSTPGLTIQRNMGISLVHSPVIIFLDDDTILDKEYVRKIFEVYAEDTEGTVAGIQGSFINDKKWSWFGIFFRRMFMLPGSTGLGRMQASGFPSYVVLPNKVIDVDMICGGNTSYRREVLDQFKWNEVFSGYSYMEDDDYSYRVSREFRLVQTPAARLVHEQSPVARDNMEKQLRMEVRNHVLFFKLNMPKTLWTFVAFVWSEIGCCLLTLRCYGVRGFMTRGKAYVE